MHITTDIVFEWNFTRISFNSLSRQFPAASSLWSSSLSLSLYNCSDHSTLTCHLINVNCLCTSTVYTIISVALHISQSDKKPFKFIYQFTSRPPSIIELFHRARWIALTMRIAYTKVSSNEWNVYAIFKLKFCMRHATSIGYHMWSRALNVELWMGLIERVLPTAWC